MSGGFAEPSAGCGMVECVFPRARLLSECARHIIERHGTAFLREVIVLVPDLHCVRDVSRALHAAAALPVLWTVTS